MGLFGKIFGGESNYNKNIKDLKAAKREARDVYTSRANEDYMQTAEAQAALTEMRDALGERYKNAEAAQAVTGATDESIALQKKAANEAVGDVTRQLASRGTQRHDSAMDDYLNATASYNNAIAQQRAARANAQTQALGGLINTAKDVAVAGFGGAFKKQNN